MVQSGAPLAVSLSCDINTGTNQSDIRMSINHYRSKIFCAIKPLGCLSVSSSEIFFKLICPTHYALFS